MTNVLVRRVRAAASIIVVLGLVAALAPARPAAAREGESPASVSASLHYMVTFVARACDSYQSVMGNRVRDDNAENAAPLGRDSAYHDGDEVDPQVEAAGSSGCAPLNGWAFALGAGHDKQGALSGVTTPATGSGPTAAAAPLLDRTGQKTGATIDGAVTVTLTDEQAKAAARHQLWAQGGSPGDPLLAAAQAGSAGYGFGSLRCAIDGHTNANVQWVAFPSGARHVFCFAYYVKAAQPTATLIVRARTTTAPGYPQRFTFDASASYDPRRRLDIDARTDATLVRSAGGAPGTVVAHTPAGWSLADLSCTKSGAGRSLATTDGPTATATVTLSAGEVVTCTFTFAPPPVPPGLTLRLYSDTAGGAFDVAVADPAGGAPRHLSATATGDGSASAAAGADLGTLLPGAYAVTLTPPAGDAAAWSLTGAGCGEQELKPAGWTVTVTLGIAAATDCALRVSRKAGSIELRAVTVGGTAVAGFAVTPRRQGLIGWSGVSTTAALGEPAVAQGDVPGSLTFAEYLVTPIPPLSTVAGSWRLSSFNCDPGASVDPGDGAAGVVPLSAADPAAKCTATYTFQAARQLQLTVRFAGSAAGRAGAVVVDIDCEDGSSGRAVLAGDDNGEASLPEPIGFLGPTRCTLQPPQTPSAKNAQVTVAATVDPNPGNAPVAIPGPVQIGAGDGADADSGQEYHLVVTVTFDVDGVRPTQQRVLDTFRVLPVALIGAGLVGLGLLILLVMVLRSRTD